MKRSTRHLDKLPYRCTFLAVLLFSLISAEPRPASAGGFTIPTIGGRMSGQGFFVGYPDDTSAIYHNPAGLTLIDGYRIDVAVLGIYSGTDYRRYEGAYQYDSNTKLSTAPADATLSESAKPDPPFGVLPYAGFSGDFGLKNLRFGLAVLSPHNATGNFPVDGPQRYQVIKGTIFTVFTLPTVAWRPLPWLSVGAQIGPAFAKIYYERAQSVLLPQDAGVEVDASAWSFAWGLGVLVQPIDRLSFGLSYSGQTTFDFSGTISLTNLPKGAVPGDKSSISGKGGATFDFPRMLRVGVAYLVTPDLMLGVDFQWQHYSVYDALRLSMEEPLKITILGQEQTIDEMEEIKNSTDAFTVALGGRYSLLDQLDLRAGLLYDKSPYPDTTYTILNPDHDKAGFTLGASYRFSFGLELTLAYVHLFYFDRTITETIACQRITLGGMERCAADTEAGGEVHGKMVLLFGGQASYSF